MLPMTESEQLLAPEKGLAGKGGSIPPVSTFYYHDVSVSPNSFVEPVACQCGGCDRLAVYRVTSQRIRRVSLPVQSEKESFWIYEYKGVKRSHHWCWEHLPQDAKLVLENGYRAESEEMGET